MRITTAVLLFSCVILSNSFAQIGHNESLNDLVAKSNVIVVGETQSVEKVGRSSVSGTGASVEKVRIRVSELVKGDASKPEIELTFLLPDHPIGYLGVPGNSFRIVFLRTTGSELEVSTYERPSLPACIGYRSTGLDTHARVLQHVLAAVSCSHLSDQQRLEAVEFLKGLPGPATTTALKGALAREPLDSTVSLAMIAELLRRNDAAVLPRAKAIVQKQEADVSRLVYRNNVALAIGELHSPTAIPGLADLITARDVVVRRSAARALRQSYSSLAVAPLAEGLRDNDFEVRYLAVVGLAEISGQKGWRPLENEFKANEQKYLRHWSEWAVSDPAHTTSNSDKQRF